MKLQSLDKEDLEKLLWLLVGTSGGSEGNSIMGKKCNRRTISLFQSKHLLILLVKPPLRQDEIRRMVESKTEL